ncbi:MAG: VWA domain-containing protein, partial [Ignavibacteriae bacterium]
ATTIPLTTWTIDALAERPIEIPSLVGVTPAESTIEERHVQYQMSSQFLQQAVVGFRYRLKYDGLTMSVLSTKPVGEDGYALMMAVPESDASIEEVLPKRFTFVIDHSGSMSGEKMAQARQAAEYCVRRLNPDDVLSVIQFSSSTWIWGDPHKPATPTNIESAAAYIRSINPDGGTDIMLALKVALQRHANDRYVNVIIFLTDGQAPIDHATLASYNTSATRIFVFGIGSGVNETDLRKIAEDHKGSYHFVTDPAMTVANVSELFDRINDPLIKNPAVRFSPDVVYDVYPTVVPDVYKGEELLLVGRYTTPGDVTVSVSGSNREGAVQHQFAAHLTDDPNIHTFVGKIWAKYRIAMLLDMMKKEATGSSNWKEWRDEIIRLGREFSIVTPFTSFVDGGQTDPGDDADDGTDDGTDDNSNTTTVEHDEIIVARERCTITPNPVATTTHISIDLTDMDRSNVRVEIVDLAGRTIAVLYDDATAPERLELDWNVMDQTGVSVPAGAYLVCVTIGGVRSTATISVVR